jgi:hypothetical protein
MRTVGVCLTNTGRSLSRPYENGAEWEAGYCKNLNPWTAIFCRLVPVTSNFSGTLGFFEKILNISKISFMDTITTPGLVTLGFLAIIFDKSEKRRRRGAPARENQAKRY